MPVCSYGYCVTFLANVCHSSCMSDTSDMVDDSAIAILTRESVIDRLTRRANELAAAPPGAPAGAGKP